MKPVAVCAVLVLAACHSQTESSQTDAKAPLPLRAVYRDANSIMALVVPEADRLKPPDNCGAPLLIDTLTGAVRVLTDAEVQARLRTMQLAGASRTACPR